MSTSKFRQALGWTLHYWDEIGVWDKNESILKKFLTFFSPPPDINKQISLLEIIKKYHNDDLIISLDEINSLLETLNKYKNKPKYKIKYNDGVDYPIYFGVLKIRIQDSRAGSEFISNFISGFVSSCYEKLKKIDYTESDQKIYKIVLALRELERVSTIKKNNDSNDIIIKLRTPDTIDLDRYNDDIRTVKYSKSNSFWKNFNYTPVSQTDSKQKNTPKKSNPKNNHHNKTPEKIEKSISENHTPRLVNNRKKSWTTANKEIESVFDYSSLSLQSVVEFIAFVDEKKSELNGLLMLCFLTGMTLKKAIFAIRFSSNKKLLTVSISNTPTDSDLCSEIELKISPDSLVHLDEKKLSIEQLVDKIEGKFSYLTRQFAEFSGGNTLHFDRIASNSNRLLTPQVDDIRVHYLRGKIGFSMSAPFSYVALTNEEIGDLYQKRFNILSAQLETPELLSQLHWDSTLENQSLGSNRLPQSSVADFFRDISAMFNSKKTLFSISRSNQLRVDLANLIEINTYFLELLFFSNRPNGKKSTSIFSDFFIRNDKNSVNYEEYKAIPIPDLYLKQKEMLSSVRFSLYKYFNFTDTDISKRDLIIIHVLQDEKYHQIESAPHRQILEFLKTFNLEEIRPSNNTLRHYSGNALKFKPIISRALLGHNEDGFYYSSPASSSNIVSIHTDLSEYQNTLIEEFSLKELTYDFD
ncbi:MAG: hypothetical protein KJ609_18485 [Gammaproteobacteria bacterium]|nr:hypothetical protein [Gammaproteobacteria bacterium]MBU2239965.1 hypothetical protein [Gammaproteobacteria bacterium]MBU2320542.1 hypothetical protein [Gammaproteobacteria bacterium]